MGSRLVPDPSSDLASAAAEADLSAGEPLYRCHDRDIEGNLFNPHHGSGGRFHWFRANDGTQVPILYAGSTHECALFETVFHNVPLTEPPSRVLLGRRLIGKCVSQLQVSGATDLKLVQLHDPGLLRLSLRPAQITATNTSHYPRTRRWAEEIHRQIDWAQGLIWMSARMNCDRAVILFGDRVDPSALTVTGPPVDLDDSAGVMYVRDIGAKAGIRVTWPSSIPAP